MTSSRDVAAPKRLSPDARRAQILAAVVPAIIEHGAAVSSRQLADAAGVAEGTIFRAFGDKESLLRAVLAQEERAVYDLTDFDDVEFDDLEQVIAELLDTIVARMTRFMRVVYAIAHALDGGGPDHRQWIDWLAGLGRILEPHAAHLRVPVDAAALAVAALASTSTHSLAVGDGGPAPEGLPAVLAREVVLDILMHGLVAGDPHREGAAPTGAVSAPATPPVTPPTDPPAPPRAYDARAG